MDQTRIEEVILGYRIIKPEYEEAANVLSDRVVYSAIKMGEGYYSIDFNRKSIDNFKKAGVLDLWFEPVYKPTELVRSWEEAFNGSGYYVRDDSGVKDHETENKNPIHKNVFKLEAQAKSALAFAQLSHIVADANGDWVADWDDSNQRKYVVIMSRNILLSTFYTDFNQFLPMRSAEIRNECLKKHRTLWEDFWMISK